MSNLHSALKSFDALHEKVPDLTYITSETNYKGVTEAFDYLCRNHADDMVKEEMGRRHYLWNQQKQCYHIDKALFFAIITRLNFINESTESFHGTPEAFNVGKKLLQKVFHNKMEKLGWEKNEEANCWNYVGIENTTISEETTIPDEVSDNVSVVSAVTGASAQWPSVSQSSAHSTGSVRSAHSTGGSGIWSGVVQGFSDNPEIKMWEERLVETKKKKEDFLGNVNYDPDRPGHIAQLKNLDDKIARCEREIKELKAKLLDYVSESDDGW